MPTKEEWKKVHAELAAKLNLPCMLRFRTDVKIGQHIWNCGYEFNPSAECYIDVNPEIDFRVPHHLILHEGAHHRAQVLHDPYSGHNEDWARVLCRMYEEAEVALPHSTGFEEFAIVAGIKFKIFEQHGSKGVLSRNMVVETEHDGAAEEETQKALLRERIRLRRGPLFA